MNWRTRIWNLPANVAVFLVRVYQKTLSPIIGRQCRFYPTCSQYYILAVRKYGFCYGSCLGLWRILRCNPFCRGGEDFP
ncbi:MAG: membrane protein insertion efficiency factor YidD [Planctomycetia bacterium]|nr:membrane protein insertion efficiency factor YidD [Planctomycetia bacterium]